MPKSKHHLSWRSRISHRLKACLTDWRFISVAISAVISIIITIAAYRFIPTASQPNTFSGAVFASWVSGVAIFILVGSIVAFASLARPEDESPETRARILFRRQSGRHIDYILTKIGSSFEPYVEESKKRIVVTEYHASEKKFRVTSESRSVVRGYIDDMHATYKSAVQYKSATTSPTGHATRRLTYLRIDGKPEGAGEEFSENLSRPFNTQVPINGNCVVEYQLDYWLEESEEPNRLTTTRYTQRHTLEIENHILGQTVRVTFKPKRGESKDIFIKSGESHTVVAMSEFEPEEHIYDFRLALAV
jgi:hypothetical protein